MQFELLFTDEASQALDVLEANNPEKAAKVYRILGLMETNLRHRSLNTHKYESLTGPAGEEVFEAYVENNTPGAWRVFWCYGPDRRQITIIAITPHP